MVISVLGNESLLAQAIVNHLSRTKGRNFLKLRESNYLDSFRTP